MDRDQARRIVEASLARDSSTPDHGAPNRQAFLARERDKLRACLIEPTPVQARPCSWAVEYAALPDRTFEMVAVARLDSRYLLYDCASSEFYLATAPENGEGLSLLGFHSDDALAEWRG